MSETSGPAVSYIIAQADVPAPGAGVGTEPGAHEAGGAAHGVEIRTPGEEAHGSTSRRSMPRLTLPSSSGSPSPSARSIC